MKKTIFLLSFLILFSACKSYNDFIKIRKYYYINKTDTLQDLRYLNGNINNNNVKLLFDTGATKTVLYNIKTIGGKSVLNKNNNSKIAAKGATYKADITKYITDSIRFKIFNSIFQPVLIAENLIQNNCNNAVTIDGIFGIDALSNSEQPLLIDYQKGLLSFANPLEIKNEYLLIESSFDYNSISIYCYVNNQKEKFLFDTGADASILVKKTPEHAITVAEIQTLISTFSKSAFMEPVSIQFFQKDKINIGGITIEKPLLTKISNINRNIIGFNFIKNYNWLIDFKNEKLYAKIIKDFDFQLIKENLKKNQLKSISFDNKLIIGYKSTLITKYKIGDQLTSINDQKVSPENICQMQDLLNNTEDWSTLKLEIIPVKN